MLKFLREWGSLILIILLILLVRIFVFEPVTVKGHSMDPTLADGQKLIVSKVFQPERFDIITTVEPNDQSKVAVKRLIGLPGDTIEYKNDQLLINGKAYNEPYLKDFKAKFAKDRLQEEYSYSADYRNTAATVSNFTQDFSIKVPEGKYFVMGDNRLVSLDSREFGFITKKLMRGEVVLRYFPFDRIKMFKD